MWCSVLFIFANIDVSMACHCQMGSQVWSSKLAFFSFAWKHESSSSWYVIQLHTTSNTTLTLPTAALRTRQALDDSHLAYQARSDTKQRWENAKWTLFIQPKDSLKINRKDLFKIKSHHWKLRTSALELFCTWEVAAQNQDHTVHKRVFFRPFWLRLFYF